MNMNKVKLNANLSKNYTTFMTPLLRAIRESEGSVVEMGAGPFSTPLMHWVLKDLRRPLVSYENEKDYYEFARTFQSPLHRIRFVVDWDMVDTKTHRGVVFIDHHPPQRRKIDTLRFKDSADYIVIHDTERVNDEYDMASAFDQFKYVYTWKECHPWTSVVSNFKDVSKWT